MAAFDTPFANPFQHNVSPGSETLHSNQHLTSPIQSPLITRVCTHTYLKHL